MMEVIIWLLVVGLILYKNVKKTQVKKERQQPAPGRMLQQRPIQQPAPGRMPQQRPIQQPAPGRMPQQRPIQQPAPGRMPQQETDIMHRAAANARENEVDELAQEGGLEQTSELMRQVNDLMLMGYQANLSFERDFVAEGVDMLNSYEISEV